MEYDVFMILFLCSCLFSLFFRAGYKNCNGFVVSTICINKLFHFFVRIAVAFELKNLWACVFLSNMYAINSVKCCGDEKHITTFILYFPELLFQYLITLAVFRCISFHCHHQPSPPLLPPWHSIVRDINAVVSFGSCFLLLLRFFVCCLFYITIFHALVVCEWHIQSFIDKYTVSCDRINGTVNLLLCI